METHSASAHGSPLHLLPTPLLALVASHLPPASLLRLQRSSSALHRLRSDESYMAAVWRWAELRVEVLRDIDRWEVEREASTHETATMRFDDDIRCSLVLSACPYLQLLHLTNDTDRWVESDLDDIFASVPRLRTLHLDECSGDRDWKWFRATLDKLPQLTSLRCTNLRRFGVRGVLNIASHSTLDDVHTKSGRHCLDRQRVDWGEDDVSHQ